MLLPSTGLSPALKTVCSLIKTAERTATFCDRISHPALETVVETAHAHNTLGVILPNIRAVGALSATLQQRLATSEMLLAAQSLFLQQELQAVLKILNGAGVEAVALKGAFLASCVYNDFAARPMNDFDLFVQQKALEPAAMALQQAGYLCEEGGPGAVPPGGSLEFRSPVGHAIELRYELTQGTRLRGVFRFEEEEMWDRRQTFETASGAKLLSLSPTDHLLYLVYHAGVLHLFTALIWLVDLDRFIRMFWKEITWMELVQRARRSGCATCLWHGLGLARELLATPVDETVLDALAPGPVRGALVRWWLGPHRALRGMTPPLGLQMQASQMLLVDSAAADLRCLWQGFFPPRQWLMWRYHTTNPVSLAFFRAIHPLGGWARSRK